MSPSAYFAAGKKSDLLVNFVEGALRNHQCFFGTFFVACFQICFIVHQAVVFFLNRAQFVSNSFTNCKFKVTVAFASKVVLNFFEALAGNRAVDGYQVVDAVFAFTINDLSLGVGNCTLEFLMMVSGGSSRKMVALTFSSDLDIFLVWVSQRHDSCGSLWNVCFLERGIRYRTDR